MEPCKVFSSSMHLSVRGVILITVIEFYLALLWVMGCVFLSFMIKLLFTIGYMSILSDILIGNGRIFIFHFIRKLSRI